MLKWMIPALLVAGPAMAQDGAMAPYAAYSHAFAAMAGWALLMLVLSFASIAGKPRARTESGHPVRDYSDAYYRRSRAFLNAVEAAGPFIAATVAAVLVGAAPFWVNLLASVFLVARIAMAAVHIGTENQALRSACYGVGMFSTAGLAIFALIGAFS